MESFRSGFYITSKKERKPEATLSTSSSIQPQPFSQQSETQAQEEQKRAQKIAHPITPTSEEKPRKQVKSALHEEVSEFNPSGQMSMEQLIKVVLNLQEEIKNLKYLYEKLLEKLEQQQEIEESRAMTQDRDMNAFWDTQNDQIRKTDQLAQRMKKQEEKLKETKSEKIAKVETGSIPIILEPQAQPRISQSRSGRDASVAEVKNIYIGTVGSFNRSNGISDNTKEQKKLDQTKFSVTRMELCTSGS